MPNHIKILVIDDDPAIGDSCRLILRRSGHEVEVVQSGSQGLARLSSVSFDLVLLDLRMPDMDGMTLLQHIREQDPRALVIVISGYGSVETAVEAMKLGAFDFVAKPFTPDELRRAVDRAQEQRELLLKDAILREETRRKSALTQIITASPKMQKLLAMLEKVARTDTTVLFTGESGTGKGLMARRLHELSPRRDHAFVAVDCSTLVPTLFESELFGHVKGAFTGADSNKIGKFELSDGGTLFFDEIGNISLDIQAKLLKAVEERAISKVGSNRLIRVNTRLVAATNKDLNQAVKEGTFREDLFYRFNVIHIHLPPLRERPEDVPLLAQHFLERFKRLATVELEGFTSAALEMLKNHSWPGNVRELENTVQRLAILAAKPLIDVDDIQGTTPLISSEPAESESLLLSEMEKRHIQKALRLMQGHRSRTAAALGIDRKTLRQKMRRYGLDGR